MRLICKTCKVVISNNLVKLQDSSLLNENDGEDYIPLGFYTVKDGMSNNKFKGKIIINLKDLINSKHHSDIYRLNGCCGLDGLDGINRVCINNHEIGTEKSDCWMPHYVSIDPKLVEWIND